MQVGDTYEVRDTVREEYTAISLGSGSLPVLGTPHLAAMMENAAFTLMQKSLSDGKSSVGVKLDISHVSPSPIGIAIFAVAEVTAISENGKLVDFKVTGYDDTGLIGEGTHQRAVVTADRFLAKCESKLNV